MTARSRRRGGIPSLHACVALVPLALWGGGPAPVSASPAEFDLLAAKLNAEPQDLLAGNELRSVCRLRKAVAACIEFFDRLVSSHPHVSAARYNAALAYVDKLPGHSLLAQARLSTHSIEHATAVLDRSPDDWVALYIRGLNNLYWPKWYRRTGRSIEDLSRCVRLGEALAPAQRKPHLALAYVALGDAYAKQEQMEQARQTWQRGVAMIGESQELRTRLDTPVEALPALVETKRSRDAPVDTDLRALLAADRS